MRAVAALFLAAASLLPAAVAQARPTGPGLPLTNDLPEDPGVWGDASPEAFAPTSRLLYVNPCFPSGCNVTRSSVNSSISNSSTLPEAATAHLDAYAWGQAHFDSVMECVRRKMSMFDVQITTTDPGTVTHYEVMAAGSTDQLRPNHPAGGVAPYIGCGASIANGLAFVFASDTSAKEYLCTAIVHEAGHLWGLDHSTDGWDHMSYERLGLEKWWQNGEAMCHDNMGQVRPCSCNSGTQNTFRTLRDTFGMAIGLEASTMAITSPKDGDWVRAEFGIAATYTSPLDRLDANFFVDGMLTSHFGLGREAPLLTGKAPATLAPGDHAIRVTATDYADRTGETTVNVRLLATCTTTADCTQAGYECLANTCLPPATVAGGLGAECVEREECASGVCGKADGEAYCVAACNAGEECPDGFYCRGGADGVCWPGENPDMDGNGTPDAEEGGCAAGGSGGGALAGFATLGALLIARRRRR